MDRAVILGASRGLGAQLARYACSTTYPVVGFGRKQSALQALREEHPLFSYEVADFSKPADQDRVIEYLLNGNFNKVFYIAGGGPYGPFVKHGFKDHDWAWEVTFRFPARLVHVLAAAHPLAQLILTGSSVAESSADPLAASYCAGKHALKGLFTSVAKELPEWDLRLFSPGYMDTEMLPANAAVRQLGVYDPGQIARELWTWSLSADKGGHKLYPKHPA